MGATREAQPNGSIQDRGRDVRLGEGMIRMVDRSRRFARWQGRMLVVLASLAAALAACDSGSEVGCTAKGCSSEVSVELPELRGPAGSKYMIELCVNSACKEIPRVIEGDDLDRAPVYQAMPEAVESVQISVTVRDASGKNVDHAEGNVPVTVTHPNGPDCPPECRSVMVRAVEGRLIDA